ncbi:MAG TPA: hypothetical protein PK417_00490 [Hyphomonas sp.]|nr:hypothetical protein [Hyphomonas sp.]HRX73500.1 hypothetical protein [Hyphomonas sp.]
MVTSVAKLEEILHDITTRTDVLIQTAEVYYFMCRHLRHMKYRPGEKSYKLTRHAVGYELVSRICRLTETDVSNHGYSGLLHRLDEGQLVKDILSGARFQGKVSSREFKQGINAVKSELRALQKSVAYQRILVFRHRFVGHIQPDPRIVTDKTVKAGADVQTAEVRDFRKVVKRIGDLNVQTNKVLRGRPIDTQTIALLARDNVRELWLGSKITPSDWP